MVKIELMKDFSEIIQYDHAEVPLYIKTADLSVYPDMSAPCHWHDDIEWIYIWKGNMYYSINGRRQLLQEKDSLMVNARQMHYGYAYQKQNCSFSCILFHPSLFCNNQPLMQKYVTPVLKNNSFEYLYFPPDKEPGREISGYMEQIILAKETAQEGYELEVIAVMNRIWSRLWQMQLLQPLKDGQLVLDDLNIQKDMVAFIYAHYREKISLEDIAAAGNVSRSKCCRIFKHYLQQSPVDFLNMYRLKVSCCLLDTTDKNITEIAFACGFNHLSYFSKYFYSSYGCTPREYRKQRRRKTI